MDFLLEIQTEEIPAFDQIKAAKNLQIYFDEQFDKYFSGIKLNTDLFFTPRRLAILVSGLPNYIAIKDEEIRGPSLKAPQQAVNGFLSSNKIQLAQTTQKDGYYFYVKKGGSVEAIKILSQICLDVLNKLSLQWDKTMKINNTNTLWIRPIQQILAICDDSRIIDFEFAGLKTTNKTTGHRFFCGSFNVKQSFVNNLFGLGFNKKFGGGFAIKNPLDYKQIMKHNFVIASFDERIKMIKEQITEIELKFDIIYDGDEDIIKENAMLCEYPVLLDAKINDDLVKSIPHKLITLTIKKNQRYLIFKTKNTPSNTFDESLSDVFAIVSNNPKASSCKATQKNIIEGNLRVLNARLSDAKFFIQGDINDGLEKIGNKLKSIQFIKDLGTIEDRVSRMQSIFNILNNYIKLETHNVAEIQTAIDISKNDLASTTVGEFTELQGYVGAYIALTTTNSGQKLYNDNIVLALKNQYTNFLSGNITEDLLKFIDNLEKLASFFATNQIPTSSKDPYALKRSANFVVEFVIEYFVVNRFFYQGVLLSDLSISQIINDIFLLDSYKFASNENKQKLINFINEKFELIFVDGVNDKQSKEYIQKLIKKHFDGGLDTHLLFAFSEINKQIKNNSPLLQFVNVVERLKNILPASSSLSNRPTINENLFDKSAPYENNLYNLYIKYNNLKTISSPINGFNKSICNVANCCVEFVNQDAINVISTFADNVLVNHPDDKIRTNRQNLVNSVVLLFEDILV